MDASVLLRRKIIKGSKGREGQGWGGGERNGVKGVSAVGGDRGEVQSQKIEWRCVALQGVELTVATRKSQMPGKQEFPRTQV